MQERNMTISWHPGRVAYMHAFPTLVVGLLDFKLNSSPRAVYSSLIPGVPQSVPGVPNRGVSLGAQPQSVSGVSSPKPGVPNLCPERVGMFEVK